MRIRAFGSLLALSLSGAAWAEDPPPGPDWPWAGDISAGLVTTSGNSKTQSSNAKVQVVYTSKLWRDTLDASALHTSQTDRATGVKSDTAERYTAGNKTDYNFTANDYAFLQLTYEKDLFGPIAETKSETIGYGRKILTGPTHLLEAEIGAGARQTTTHANPDLIPPVLAVDANDAIGRARIGYKWNLSETSYFSENLKVESGKSNTASESVSELKFSIIGKLFALASFTARNNTDVPPGTLKTDTITAFNLGWSFGK